MSRVVHYFFTPPVRSKDTMEHLRFEPYFEKQLQVVSLKLFRNVESDPQNLVALHRQRQKNVNGMLSTCISLQ